MRPSAKLLLVSLLFLPLLQCSDREGSRRPNVLLISIDTLRPDHLSCYGYGRQTSPSIDALAAEGALFEQHVSSSSWTLPAHTALFTGVSDSVHGNMEATGTALSPAFTTLAERFGAGGYPTGGFYAGPYLHEAFGLGQGFDTYRYCASETGELAADQVEAWAMDADVMAASHRGSTNRAVYAAAREWMNEQREEPFFCFVHLWDVHFDFTPPPPYDTLFDPGYDGDFDGTGFFFDPRIRSGQLAQRDKDHLVALYDGEIRWTDDTIGDLLADLDEWGIADDTVVVLTSDHGTEFWEHGGIAHRTTLFEEQVRTPLVVRYPRRIPAGTRVREQTRIIDVAPTLCQLADLPDLPGAMGSSLVGLSRGEALDFDNDALSELFSVGRRLRSLRTSDAKLIDDLGAEHAQWYSLAGRAREGQGRDDLDVGTGADLMERYRARMSALAEAIRSRPGAPVSPELDADLLNELRVNGYIGDGE